MRCPACAELFSAKKIAKAIFDDIQEWFNKEEFELEESDVDTFEKLKRKWLE